MDSRDIRTDPDEGIEYLSDTQLADLNAHLAAIRAERSAWHPIAVENEQIITDIQQICQQTQISFVRISFADTPAPKPKAKTASCG